MIKKNYRISRSSCYESHAVLELSNVPNSRSCTIEQNRVGNSRAGNRGKNNCLTGSSVKLCCSFQTKPNCATDKSKQWENWVKLMMVLGKKSGGLQRSQRPWKTWFCTNYWEISVPTNINLLVVLKKISEDRTDGAFSSIWWQ